MAKSLLEKARVAVLSRLHELLDKVVNTPEGFKQYIRDLESAIANLQAARDEAVGTVNGINREIAKKERQKVERQADIDLLLSDDDPSNDEAALKLQMKLEDGSASIVTLEGQRTQAQDTVDELGEAIEQLQTRREQMSEQYQQLVITMATTKAKDKASDAAEAASGAASDAPDIDSIQAAADRESDTADARFDRVFDGMKQAETPEGLAKLARARDALEQRRRALEAAATQ